MAVEKSSEIKPATDAPVAEKAAGAPAGGEAIVDDFGRLVANMSRLLNGFGQLKPLREAGLGLGEWVALSVLARQEDITSKLMSQRLGIPVQRVAQIYLSLAENGLIAIGQPAEDPKAAKVTKLTDEGKIKLEAVNAKMKSVLGATVKARSLSGTLKQLQSLSRIVRSTTPKRTSKKKVKPAKPVKGKVASGAQASPARA